MISLLASSINAVPGVSRSSRNSSIFPCSKGVKIRDRMSRPMARIGRLVSFGLRSAANTFSKYSGWTSATPSQWAALKALEIREPFVQAMRAEYDRRRKLIVGGLNTLGLPCGEPRGAFYAFPCITTTGMDDNEFAEKLLTEEQVAVIPGRGFGKSGTGFVRMSYATAYEKIEIALDRIAQFVQRYK